MPPQPWILVTPSSQGIGLALTRRLLNTTRLPVVATARTDIQSTKKQILEGLDINEHRLEVLKVDVTGIVFNSDILCPQQYRSRERTGMNSLLIAIHV